jgi:hypothetical protein
MWQEGLEDAKRPGLSTKNGRIVPFGSGLADDRARECLSCSSPALTMPNKASRSLSSTWLPAKRKENRGQKASQKPLKRGI